MSEAANCVRRDDLPLREQLRDNPRASAYYELGQREFNNCYSDWYEEDSRMRRQFQDPHFDLTSLKRARTNSDVTWSPRIPSFDMQSHLEPCQMFLNPMSPPNTRRPMLLPGYGGMPRSPQESIHGQRRFLKSSIPGDFATSSLWNGIGNIPLSQQRSFGEKNRSRGVSCAPNYVPRRHSHLNKGLEPRIHLRQSSVAPKSRGSRHDTIALSADDDFQTPKEWYDRHGYEKVPGRGKDLAFDKANFRESMKTIPDFAYCTPLAVKPLNRKISRDLNGLQSPPVNTTNMAGIKEPSFSENDPAYLKQCSEKQISNSGRSSATKSNATKAANKKAAYKRDQECQQAIKIAQQESLGKMERAYDDLFEENPEEEIKDMRRQERAQIEFRKQIIKKKAEIVDAYGKLAQKECENLSQQVLEEQNQVRRAKRRKLIVDDKAEEQKRAAERDHKRKENAANMLKEKKSQREMAQLEVDGERERQEIKELKDLEQLQRRQEDSRAYASAIRAQKVSGGQRKFHVRSEPPTGPGSNPDDLIINDGDDDGSDLKVELNSGRSCQSCLQTRLMECFSGRENSKFENHKTGSKKMCLQCRAGDKDGSITSQDKSQLEAGKARQPVEPNSVVTTRSLASATNQNTELTLRVETTSSSLSTKPVTLASLRGKDWRQKIAAAETQRNLSQIVQKEISKIKFAQAEKQDKAADDKFKKLEAEIALLKAQKEKQVQKQRSDVEKAKVKSELTKAKEERAKAKKEMNKVREERAKVDKEVAEIQKLKDAVAHDEFMKAPFKNLHLNSAIMTKEEARQHHHVIKQGLDKMSKDYFADLKRFQNRTKNELRKTYSQLELSKETIEQTIEKVYATKEETWENNRKKSGKFNREDQFQLSQAKTPEDCASLAQSKKVPQLLAGQQRQEGTRRQEKEQRRQMKRQREVVVAEGEETAAYKSPHIGHFVKPIAQTALAHFESDSSEESEEDPDLEVEVATVAAPISSNNVSDPMDSDSEMADQVSEVPDGVEDQEAAESDDSTDVKPSGTSEAIIGADTDRVHMYCVMHVETSDAVKEPLLLRSFLDKREANMFAQQELQKERFGGTLPITNINGGINQDTGLYKGKVTLDFGKEVHKVYVTRTRELKSDLANFNRREFVTVLPSSIFNIVKEISVDGALQSSEIVAVTSTLEHGNAQALVHCDAWAQTQIGRRLDEVTEYHNELFPLLRNMSNNASDAHEPVSLEVEGEHATIKVSCTGPYQVLGPLN